MTTIEELEARIRSLGSCVVAFSGGVDSSLVAALAARALGERALAVTAVSPALATGELDGARDVARAIGIRHETITTAELEREGYRANDRDRCYHCKSELYDRLAALAARRAVRGRALRRERRRPRRLAARARPPPPSTVSSTRCSRPGSARTRCGELARELGVPSAEKPASPCLASRIPYGTAVDPDVLAQIDRAELAVKALGYRVLRVRHYGALGRVELAEDELDALTPSVARRSWRRSRAAGYAEVEIADEPFRSGSLNASFTKRLAVAS